MSPRPKVALDLETVIEAAADIADQFGVQEVTLANLAKRLNIRPPSLYNHVEGLPGLRKELAILGLNKLYAELSATAVGLTGENAIIELSKTYINFARKHPGLYEATLLAPDPKDQDVQLSGGKIIDLTINVLREYDLEGDSALHAVRGLRSILHGFSSLEQKGGLELALDLDVSLRLIIKAFLAGIGELKK
ncbi:WHG domain-containing protein [Neobacillus sp. PS3-12]|jgi:AcrR family transcriptional regulator|uniref:TetR/AcrR family transcriptional regulator n=1 Tax=Neobacillus sp. PS3-12 TaxID=3070677 RepID=UPI0027E1D592|nr:WHG domain-containing protein [Neobacillus sp. PS3-12]WML51009.1 WHG domain-containing protein [Neobacillus sp. PS3-12]